MEHAFSQVPQKDATHLGEVKPHLLDIAADVSEDIIGIIYIESGVCMVVTTTRLIEMTSRGGMQVTPYAELSLVDVVGGKKKRFGGYDTMIMRIHFRDGKQRNLVLYGDPEWTLRIGAAAESAFNKARLRAT